MDKDIALYVSLFIKYKPVNNVYRNTKNKAVTSGGRYL